jgi:acetyl-CoA C-acetyltransferase
MDIFITGAARTPMGGFQGELSGLTGPQLGAAAIRAAVARAGVKAEEVDEAYMGCVLPAGVGQAPARQASIHGGLPNTVPCTTVNKVCGSGMKALMLAADQLRDGGAGVIVAGGMESMTNAPYLLPKARGGLRLGHGEIKDHMFLDGLEDAYEGRLMGTYAEDAARHYQFTRAEQDAYAIESLARAQRAQKDGRTAAQGRCREDTDAEARVRKGRNRDGGEFVVDFGRGGGTRARARRCRGKARLQADCADRGAGEQRR